VGRPVGGFLPVSAAAIVRRRTAVRAGPEPRARFALPRSRPAAPPAHPRRGGKANPARGERRPLAVRPARSQHDGRHVPPPAAAPLPDGRTVRVPAPRLAAEPGDGRTDGLGSAGHAAGLARSREDASRPGHHQLGVPGRRTAGPHSARRAGRRTPHRRGHPPRRRPGRLPHPT
jgi:hypothetical protein